MSTELTSEQDEYLGRLQAAVGDRYQVLRRIGRGGMGFVFLSRETALDRLVAIKVAIVSPQDTPTTLERFRREARLAASLEHPGIVRIYAVGERDELSWFTMEYVEGPTLESLVRETGPLAPERAHQMLLELCDALSYAHSRGIVHRDVKPANVLINTDGRFLLMDFGIAKQENDGGLTTTGKIIGTPAYMSPEQLQGEGVNAASDQYALGAVAYFACTGGEPFRAGDIYSLIRAHLLETPRSLLTIDSRIDPRLDDVVQRMLAKQASDRFPTLLAATEALMGTASVRPEPRAASRTRRRLFISLAVTSALGTAAFLVLRPRAGDLPPVDSTTRLSSTPSTSVADSLARRDSAGAKVRAPAGAGGTTAQSMAPKKVVVQSAVESARALDTVPPSGAVDSPRATRAMIRVGSKISGAVLMINGAGAFVLGEPAFYDVTPGTIRLSIGAESCAPWDTTVVLAAGDSLFLGNRNPRCRL